MKSSRGRRWGIVYEAEQISLRRPVALKVLPVCRDRRSATARRFQNEAHPAASLRHPNIVPVYAVGCERGVHYYAMQYVDGQAWHRWSITLRSRGPVATAIKPGDFLEEDRGAVTVHLCPAEGRTEMNRRAVRKHVPPRTNAVEGHVCTRPPPATWRPIGRAMATRTFAAWPDWESRPRRLWITLTNMASSIATSNPPT